MHFGNLSRPESESSLESLKIDALIMSMIERSWMYNKNLYLERVIQMSIPRSKRIDNRNWWILYFELCLILQYQQSLTSELPYTLRNQSMHLPISSPPDVGFWTNITMPGMTILMNFGCLEFVYLFFPCRYYLQNGPWFLAITCGSGTSWMSVTNFLVV